MLCVLRTFYLVICVCTTDLSGSHRGQKSSPGTGVLKGSEPQCG